MQNKLDDFENELRNLVEGFEPSYSPKAWSRLSVNLPKNSAKWYLVAASVVIIASSFLIYQYSSSDEIINENTKELASVNSFAQTESVNTISENKKTKKLNASVSEDKEKPVDVKEKEEAKLLVPKQNNIEKLNTNNKLVIEELPIIDSESLVEEQTEENENLLVMSLSSKSGCSPLNVEFKLQGLSLGMDVNWVISDGYEEVSDVFNHEFKKAGLYKIKAEVNVSGKLILLEDEVLVKASPLVDFIYYEEDGRVNLENKSKDYETLNWTFSGINSDEENPSFEMLYSGSYHVDLFVENQDACSNSISKIINYKIDHHIFAPNAFSPDGDGVNDEFIVKYDSREGYKYTMQVFNATGKKLFETKDKDLGWNAENINTSSSREKFLWRLIIEDPRSVIETYEGYFVNISR